MSDKKFVLGVDIGTTSVKVCVLDCAQNKIVAKQAKDTQANVPSELGCEGNKQNPPKIISALHACVSRLPKDLLKQVDSIGVCGQMHGVMLWQYTEESGAPWERDATRYDVRPAQVSSLYTWQDSRCDPTFLATLPKPDSHLQANSGYGVNTLFWISKNRPDKLEKFNCAGTIQDFAVAMLCSLEKPIMSVQNAASWGYFDTFSSEWNTQVLEAAGFPVNLLPKVVTPGAVAGHLVEAWHGIPSGTPVGAALGDLQCSVLSGLHTPNDAVMNISTSAQLAFVAPPFTREELEESSKIEYLPYFEGNYLAVAAALNGGNVLATFISMLQHWLLDLGCSLPQSKLWDRAIELASSENAESSLEVVPTLLGERHEPEMTASVCNINLGNISLGKVFRATCKGVVQNLHSIMPRGMLSDNNINRIVCIGSALTRNKVLQSEVTNCYQLPVVFETGGGAAWGAAIAASQH